MIKSPLFVASALLGLAPIAGATEAAAPVAVPVPEVRRTTIIVADIDASLKLYRDALGMRIAHENADVIVSGVALPVGKPGNHTRLVLLRGDADRSGWIGLIQFTDPPIAPRTLASPRRLKIGDHVIVINSSDVDRQCALVAKVPGVKFTRGLGDETYAPTSTRGPITVRGCYFFDPDGTFIELVGTRPT